MPRWESIAIGLTPIAAMATLALGLRIGASESVHAAMVYGAPPAAGRSGLAWQVVTVVDDRGVREAIALPDVSLVAHAGPHEATWHGATNADGVGEAWLDLPGIHAGDRVDLEVRAASDPKPLAVGEARWQEVSWGPDGATSPWVRASKQDGDLEVDVSVEGQKLAPGFPTNVYVRVVDRATRRPVAATADAEPEPGLSLGASQVQTCKNGWGKLTATAEIHVVGLAIHATSTEGRRGEWFGALPVAPGASFVALPTSPVAPGAPLALDVLVPTVRPLVYLEVDDHAGRAFAATLAVDSHVGSVPRAKVEVPPLAAGTYWVVSSGEPRGAESLAVGAIARPLVVRANETLDMCERDRELATLPPAPFSRWLALDGTKSRHANDGGRRQRGLLLAFGALAVAAILETLLVLRAAARARREMHALATELGDETTGAPTLVSQSSIASVAIGVLLALLGFALIASLLTWHAG